MELSSQDKEDLRLLEEGLWRAEVRFDSRRMTKSLHLTSSSSAGPVARTDVKTSWILSCNPSMPGFR